MEVGRHRNGGPRVGAALSGSDLKAPGFAGGSLPREEGIFGGTSSGANVVAAIRVACSLGPGANVVTIICDSGLRYLRTDVYRAPA